MNWNDIATRHFEWVKAMGWHNKTVLESMALIGSEIGEVCGETAPDGSVTSAFGEELADVVLRTVDLAKTENVDIEAAVAGAYGTEWPNRPLHPQLTDLMAEFGQWVNTARKETLGEPFALGLGRILRRVQLLASCYNVDLPAEIERKMAVNAARGSRGRRV